MFFFRKPKKDNKKSSSKKPPAEADFLLPEDKKKIEELSRAKFKHLQSIEGLNYQILLIQNSTGTLIPKFIRLHHLLRKKYKWYYNWHTKPYSTLAHWVVLFIFVLSLPFLYGLISQKGAPITKAVDYDFPRWMWENPAPTGNTIKSVYTQSQNNTWMVGENGTIIKYDGTSFRQDYSGTYENLNGIAGVSADTIWTVGDDGIILKYNGQSWSEQVSNTTENLNAVAAVDSTNVWTVGDAGIIRKYNGSTWSQQTSGTTANLNAIFALNSQTLFIAGNQYVLKTSNGGTSWSIISDDPVAVHTGVYAWDANNILVTRGGHVMKTTNGGTEWSDITVNESITLNAITGISSANIWVVGLSGKAYVSYNEGGSWDIKPLGFTAPGSDAFNVYGISMLDSNYIWIVGDQIYESDDGQDFPRMKTGTPMDINGIMGVDSNNIYAVTGALSDQYNSQVLKINNETEPPSWDNSHSGAYYNLNDIDAYNSSNVWAVGAASWGFFKYNGSSWETKGEGEELVDNLYGVSAGSVNNVWVVGENGKIVNTTDGGENWTKQTTIGAQNLNSVSAVGGDTTTAWAVGGSATSATILKTTDGSTWDSQGAPGGVTALNDVSALNENTVWAVGAGGTIIKTIDGGATNWASQTSGVTVDLNGLYILDSDTVYAVGDSGTLLKTTDGGTSWTSIDNPTNVNLNEVYATDENNVWLVGENGAIIQFDSPANATATKLLVKLPGQSFADGVGVYGTSSAATAGVNYPVTIYAVDDNNYLDKGNASNAGFSTTDPRDSNPAVIPLTKDDTCVQNRDAPEQSTCGEGTTNFVFRAATSGSWTITANDVSGVLASGTSSLITVNPGPIENIVFDNLPSSLDAGVVSGAIGAVLKDCCNNNKTTSQSKTIRLTTTSSGGRFATSASGPWHQGQMDVTISAGGSSTNFYYLDFNAGTATLAASETPSAGWTDATGNINIGPGQLAGSTINVNNNSVGAGEELTATVTLKGGNSFLADRTVRLISSRNEDSNTPDTMTPTTAVTNASGVATFTVKPTRVGDFTITAYDETDGVYVPDEEIINVGAGDMAIIVLESSVSTAAIGTPFNISVTLYDNYSNITTGYTGDIFFFSSDADAIFDETQYTFTSNDAGSYKQSVTLNTIGDQSITAANSERTILDTIYITISSEIISSPTPTTAIISPIPTITATPTEKPKTLIEKFQDSPTAKKIAKTLIPIAVTVAALGLLPLLVQAFPQGFHLLASLFPALFTAAAARRRRKPWGSAFDSLTGKPIDLAIVRIFNADNNRLVSTKVTDQNGRFNFLLNKGRFYIRVTKPGYSFPPKMSKIKASQISTRFGPESDIYLGQPFVINKDGSNINLNISLDPKIKKQETNLKIKMWLKNGFDWFLISLSYVAIPMMLIGAFFASFATVIIPSKFNIYMSGIYMVLLIAYLITNRFRKARLGFVFDSKTKKPITGATVSIFDKEYNAIREIKATDKNGNFGILARTGQYYLTVDAPGYTFPSKKITALKEDKKLGKFYFDETLKFRKAGFINVSIPLDKKT